MHWVSSKFAINGEIRLYDRLFIKPDPENVEEGKSFIDYVNKDSLKILKDCKLEPLLKEAKNGDIFQFLRIGYFCKDPDSTEDYPVFNKTVGLKDKWKKIFKSFL